MIFYLKRMAVSNFKGIRHFETDFDHRTDILGYNKTGKTTLKDAFLWCLFGKDSQGKTDFSIKPLQENNEPIHHLDSEVQLWAMADDRDIHIRRVYREEWVTKRGSRIPELKGHKQEFFWDDVPLKESEYQAKVSGIITESVFRLLTSTEYFNSLPWQQMRSGLLKIAGHISNTNIFDQLGVNMAQQNLGEYEQLFQALNRDKSIEDYKKEIANKKKAIKDQLDLIPSRIDEATRSLSAIPEHDYDQMDQKLIALQDREKIISGQLSDFSEAERMRQIKVSEKISELYALKLELSKLEFDLKQKTLGKALEREMVITDKKNQLRNKTDHRSREAVDLSTNEKKRDGLQIIKNELAAKWEKLDAEKIEFKEDDLTCSHCGRAYDGDLLESQKQSLISNFNNNKAMRLKMMADDGLAKKNQILSLNVSISANRATIAQLDDEIVELTKQIAILENEHAACLEAEAKQSTAFENDSEYQALSEMIKLRSEEVENPEPKSDEDLQLITNRDAVRSEIDETNKILGTRETKQMITARIKELNDQEKTLAASLSNYEGIEFSIDKFSRAKMDLLEARINGRFKIVKFKMFERQLNGGEVETCITLIDGVPFRDANTAARIQAGIDIINVFSDHYGLYAPIWIDNRESVIDLPETKSQLINLFVSDKHKKLTVEMVPALAEMK